MPRQLRVFLCHASQDKAAVRELYNALKSEGWIDPWLDKAKILPGQDWEVVIEKAVEVSDVVIACLSNQSVSKEGYVQREIRYAYDIALDKPEETIFLIPLRLDDCSIPRKLKTLHWVDYFGVEKKYAYSDLLEALKLRYDQKMKAEELKQEKIKQEAEELARKLADERTIRKKAEPEAAERLAREKMERESDAKAEVNYNLQHQVKKDSSDAIQKFYTSQALSSKEGKQKKGKEEVTLQKPVKVPLAFIVVVISILVIAIAYLIYKQSHSYEIYLRQAQEMSSQALSSTDPIEQRKSWEKVLSDLDIAESHRKTPETVALRQEADANLDKLLGITRMQFNPAFSSNLGIEISRMAASETDLFLLNAATGEVLHAQLSNNGQGFQLDTTFNCMPGVYGNYTVGPLVDILTLPALNSINATLLGIDADGNLVYCAPGQIAQAIPLPPPDTSWDHVTAFTLDGGNLYVLDAPARAVWVYNGKDGTFVDRPYFFFGGQTPEKQDVIDLIISGDDLYMLHSDGHLSTCSYSRIESKPTLCQDPTPLVNPFMAYRGTDLFAGAHFTQMLFTALPNQSILLLDMDTQGVLRFTPQSLELQNQFRPTTGDANPISSGTISAIAVGTNHVLYLAVNGQVYFATDMP